MLEDFHKKINSLTKIEKRISITFFSLLIFVFFFAYIKVPPSDFPLNTVVSIEKGESLQEITNYLHSNKVIKFPLIFRSTVILFGGERNVVAGDYLLDKKEGPFDLAYRLMKGKYNADTVKITIPEGWNVYEIADYLSNNLKNFDKESFVELAKDWEGYLFPDTYFIPDTARPKTVINLMRENFEEQIKTVGGLATSTKSLHEVITMASILEGEANTTETRKVVSGILWKRITAKMPLQVDATFKYINGKGSFQLTYDDLKIDNPYNTYVYKGLPPGPIGNPGLDTINAALNPKNSRYLYFLTGRDGKMYYGRTFEEHKKNKVLYLN